MESLDWNTAASVDIKLQFSAPTVERYSLSFKEHTVYSHVSKTHTYTHSHILISSSGVISSQTSTFLLVNLQSPLAHIKTLIKTIKHTLL